MIKIQRYEKCFSFIKFISNNKKLLRNVNKSKAIVSDIEQDYGVLLAEIIKLMQLMRKKLNLHVVIEI